MVVIRIINDGSCIARRFIAYVLSVNQIASYSIRPRVVPLISGHREHLVVP